ncbi:MAG: aldo/keto reductase [Elusimicrobia bacterium]|nr:MAG: aldo/keto reductase [Elusimicrobiota bacterium]
MPSTTGLARRPLGKTGLTVSEIGFGGWGIGKSMWGHTDDSTSIKALERALELGVNYFDTAAAYGHGHSERLIAQAIKEAGATAVIGTKVPPQNMEWPAHSRTRLGHAFPPEWIKTSTERSLRNLRQDSIELLMFHVWTDSWLKDPLWDDTLQALAKLKEEGKVRAFGVSINSDDPNSALNVVRSGVVDVVQVILNLFDQRAVTQLFPLCEDKEVGVVVRCPFDEGGLTGTLTPETRFAPEDFRSYYFGGGRLEETCKRANAIDELLVPSHAQTLAQAALKFCLSFPAVSTVIPGMRTLSHVELNVGAANGRYYTEASLKTLEPHAWIRDFY